MPDQGFKKADRISSSADIREILKSGERFRVGPIQFFRKRGPFNHPRVAIAVTGSAGSSPGRNRIKRQLRELFRKNKIRFGSYDYFFYIKGAKAEFEAMDWKETGKKIIAKLQ